MVTLSDVASRAGVSRSTVSRILSGDPTLVVPDTTREKIRLAATELGYQHKRSRQAVYQIAVIHKETHYQNQVDNAFYFSIRYGMESTCRGEQVKCTFLTESMLKELPANLNGVVINGNFSRAQMETICRAVGEIPTVVVGYLNFSPRPVDWVTYDVGEAVELAVEHLAEKGKRSILYVGGKDHPDAPDQRKKLTHFRACLARHPQMKSLGEIEGEYGTESGYRMMMGWLEAGKPLPDAVFASHDPIGIGVIRALTERGVSVPGQTAVIGINGDCTCSITTPPMTTVSVFPEEMGREVVLTLLDRIRSQRTVSKKTTFRAELIPRQSV